MVFISDLLAFVKPLRFSRESARLSPRAVCRIFLTA
jgi:hypothetical protein